MPTLCVTIRKGRKEYTFHGIRHVEKRPTHVNVYVKDTSKADGVYLVNNAKITDVYITDINISDEQIATLERLEKAFHVYYSSTSSPSSITPDLSKYLYTASLAS